MRRFNGLIGIEQGTKILFSDFAHDGAMWTGSGPREVRQRQEFKESFVSPPAVTVGISMWDIDHKTNSRVDISAENVSETGFEIVFRTWADTRIARIRAEWMAIGAVSDDEHWDVG
jgi:H-type lectin domain